MTDLDETYNLSRRSWVESANRPGADFPIQNLPYGVFSQADDDRKRVGVAIGDQIVDLTALEAAGELLPTRNVRVFADGILNPFMALPQNRWAETRQWLANMLDADGGDNTLPLVAQADVTMHLPFFVRSYTDFYASREHATNVGSIFRDPTNALAPNWLHMPIGYNGRASTVVVSGTPIRRPRGQLKGPHDEIPYLGPCQKLDVELEIGAVVGTPNPMGQPLCTSQAYDNIFGYVLLNDWSARDIQVWEYQPLGPFQAKAFGTTIGPWVVTRDALAPFRQSTPEPIVPLLPYLLQNGPNNFDINLAMTLCPEGGQPTTISRTNCKHMYYSSAQQLTHHASSGCAMETGDLLGSGTISGTTPDSCGSLLEITWNGRDPLQLDGAVRTFLEDGDTVDIVGWCDGVYRIGFGHCTGQILPAIEHDGAPL